MDKTYTITLTKDEVKLLRVGLEEYQYRLEEKGIKPETVAKCDELIEKLFALVKE